MANEIEITVTGTNKAGGTLASVEKDLKGVGNAAQDAGKKTAGASSSLQRMGEVAGGITIAETLQGAADAAKNFLTSSKDAASNLGESVNAVNVVFGASAGEITKWGESNANAFGLSQREFNQKVVPLGAMLKNTGMSMDQVTDSSISLTERAADMASVFNTDVGTALDAIQAGLRGELDPLEQFGVKLSAAEVETRALADSGKTLTSELTEQEKAAARVAIIMEQTADAHGDFSNTADSAANSARRLAAESEEFKAALGEALLPVRAMANEALINLMEGFQNLPGPIQTVVGSLINIAAVAASVAPQAAMLVGGLAQMAASSTGAASAIGKIKSVAGPVAIGLGVLTAGLIAYQSISEDIANGPREFGGPDAKVIGELGTKLEGVNTHAERFGVIKKHFQDVADPRQLAAVGVSFDELSNALLNGGDSYDALIEKLRAAKEIYPSQSRLIDVVIESLGLYRGEIDGTVDPTVAATEAAEAYAKTIQGVHDAVMGFVDANLGYRNAVRDEADAFHAATEAIKEHGVGSKEAADAIAGWESSIISAVEAAGQMAASQYAGTDEMEKQRLAAEAANAEILRLAQVYGEDAPAALRQMVAGLDETSLAALGMTIEVDEAGNAVYRLPNGKTVTLSANDLASGKIAGVKRGIDSLRDREIYIDIHTTRYESAVRNAPSSYSSSNRGGLKHGGIAPATSSAPAPTGGARHGGTLINDGEGPELVKLQDGSQVMTAGATRAMAEAGLLGGGGGPAVAVLRLESSGSRIDDLLMEILREAIRDQGGNVQAVLGQ